MGTAHGQSQWTAGELTGREKTAHGPKRNYPACANYVRPRPCGKTFGAPIRTSIVRYYTIDEYVFPPLTQAYRGTYTYLTWWDTLVQDPVASNSLTICQMICRCLSYSYICFVLIYSNANTYLPTHSVRALGYMRYFSRTQLS